MTTWSQHIRHPWLVPSTMKRRLQPLSYDAPRSKRVRYNSLERTLAHMSLDAVPSQDVDMWTGVSPPRDADSLHVILPSSVEEPTTPPSELVGMEVEPTMVSTNTAASSPPAFADWKSIDSGLLDIREVEISPAALECIRRQTQRPSPLLPLPSQSSQALVLYRTLRPPSPEPFGHPSIQVAQEDDVMEVE